VRGPSWLLARGAEWVPGGGPGTFHFRRGFVEKVSASVVQFLALADELHERHSVRSVELWHDSKKKAVRKRAALAAHPV
jgi:hypothetical protein